MPVNEQVLREQEEILEDMMAAAGAEEEPDWLAFGGGEEGGLSWDDPEADSGCPAEYQGLSTAEIEALGQQWQAAQPVVAEAIPAGFLPRRGRVAAGSQAGTVPAGAGPAGGFASGGPCDAALPGPAVVALADDATGPGPDARCEGTSDDELIGLLGAWHKAEAWAASRKLAVIAELIRRRPDPACPPVTAGAPGAMPQGWGRHCGDELAAVLACSVPAAEKLLSLAHDLTARLPATALALHEGRIDLYKARLIADATQVLSAEDAAIAEARILAGAEGKTPGQLRARAARVVYQIDPDGARRRRGQAETKARVELWREDDGTAALCGRDLPPAEVLAADQHITAYARHLKAAGVDGTMDQLRARAFLDLTSGTSSMPADSPTGTGGTAATSEADLPGPVGSRPSQDRPGRDLPAGAPAHGPAAKMNITVPLATLQEQADRPGEAAGLGPLDPDLARALAAAAARNPRTTWCVTVTDQHGHPLAHGCGRPARPAGTGPPDRSRDGTGPPAGNGPATGAGRGFTFVPVPGPPGVVGMSGTGGPGPGTGGRWRLGTPAGRDYTIDLEPLAVTGCDHRRFTPAYQPGEKLRHLVNVRDQTCTYPTCRRPAERCDFEHAKPWDQGGPTCACNAGPRCRRHHRAKQAPGWRVDQHQPGYHTWTTPAGRQYITGPATYPS